MADPTLTSEPPLPRLLIIGAPKAGTTTLAAWWDLHPLGFTAPDKEVQYFNVYHERGQAWYRRQFRGMGSAQVGCDASPGYLYVPHALTRIRREIPEARLVAVLREPATRVWSHWCYFTALGAEIRPFHEVVADAEVGFSARGVDYALFSRYLAPLREVVDRFGRDQLLVLFTDEMRADRQGVFDRLCDHAGVERAPLPDTPDRNQGTFPRSARAQRLLQQARAGHWPAGIGRRLMAANASASGPPAADPELLDRLRAIFTPDLGRLQDWLGRPLPATWGATQ
ncbi:MAG TPA: sulfotransferase [Acidimicrobiales bacterium]|nr:sulfotransferase [Acidimicrobiales bacterium]